MKALYTIGMLSEATGVSPSTIRSWEKRYGFPRPTRSIKGRRQYDEDQVAIVSQLNERVEKGERISVAVKHVNLQHAASETLQQTPLPTSLQAEQISYWGFLIERMMSGVEHFDESLLNTIFSEAMSVFSVQEVTAQLLRPTLRYLGERWAERPTGVAEEHFFTAFLRAKIGVIAHHQLLQSNAGPRVLACCLPDETHEIGLLMFCLGANSQRLKTVFLGGRTPLDQIEYLANESIYKIEAVILSATMAPSRRVLTEELPHLMQNINIPVYIGGHASLLHQQTFEKMGLKVLGNDIDHAVETLARDMALDPFARKRALA